MNTEPLSLHLSARARVAAAYALERLSGLKGEERRHAVSVHAKLIASRQDLGNGVARLEAGPVELTEPEHELLRAAALSVGEQLGWPFEHAQGSLELEEALMPKEPEASPATVPPAPPPEDL